MGATLSFRRIQKNPPDIFKLNDDCFEEIFGYLSINDLYSFGQTCRRINRIAGMYFQRNYPDANITSMPKGIYYYSKFKGFSEFFESVTVFWCWPEYKYIKKQLAYIEANCKSLKRIRFLDFSATITKIDLIKGVLTKLESFEIDFADFDGNILDFCPNLKRLKICQEETSGNFDWFYKLNKCSKLEDFALTNYYGDIDINERFFDQIPNIRNMEVNWQFLLRNKNVFLNANVKLENFIIFFPEENDWDKRLVCSLLNELYDRDFYKRLHLFQEHGISYQETIDALGSLRTLHTINVLDRPRIVWPIMDDLKQINIDCYYYIHLTKFPSKLPNVERVHFRCRASMNELLAFVRGSIKLKEIFIEFWCQGTHKNEGIIDVSKLNKERAKLAGACKMIIYVHENVFLATKFRHGVNRSLVELKHCKSKKSSEWITFRFGEWL